MAVAAKGDVTIPLADYLSHIAGSPMEGEILPHVKVDPEGMTYAEGQSFYQTQEDAMVKAAEKLNAAKQQDAEYQQQAREVKDRHHQTTDRHRRVPPSSHLEAGVCVPGERG